MTRQGVLPYAARAGMPPPGPGRPCRDIRSMTPDAVTGMSEAEHPPRTGGFS